MSEQDIRWQQRFNNYFKTAAQIAAAIRRDYFSEFEALHGNLGILIEAGDT